MAKSAAQLLYGPVLVCLCCGENYAALWPFFNFRKKNVITKMEKKKSQILITLFRYHTYIMMFVRCSKTIPTCGLTDCNFLIALLNHISIFLVASEI